MPDRDELTYVFDRGRPFIDPITEEHARQIYDEASRRPGAELAGSLEAGFAYTVARSSRISFLRVRVYPIGADPTALPQ